MRTERVRLWGVEDRRRNVSERRLGPCFKRTEMISPSSKTAGCIQARLAGSVENNRQRLNLVGLLAPMNQEPMVRAENLIAGSIGHLVCESGNISVTIASTSLAEGLTGMTQVACLSSDRNPQLMHPGIVRKFMAPAQSATFPYFDARKEAVPAK